jgi:hypothetical protein
VRKQIPSEQIARTKETGLKMVDIEPGIGIE